MRVSYGKSEYEIASGFERIIVRAPVPDNKIVPTTGQQLSFDGKNFKLNAAPLYGAYRR